MRLAASLGKQLHELLGWYEIPILTNRQLQAWGIWRIEDLNHLERSDHYTLKVIDSLVGDGVSETPPLKFAIVDVEREEAVVKATEMDVARSKAAWYAACGVRKGGGK